MARNLKQLLLAHLPLGEWADVRVLNQPAGMMADRQWAVLAKAKWLRDGGKDAFIKFIVPAPSSAGADTNLVTGTARLAELETRLRDVQRFGSDVPLVPLLAVRVDESGLLIAMEQVEPLQALIEQGEAYSLSPRVLRDLNPDRPSARQWLHFDICPNNIGVAEAGRIVLIDVESFYLESDSGYAVSVPAWKPFRAPDWLRAEVISNLATGRIKHELAVQKMRFEIALAAAECVLGPMRAGRDHLDRITLDRWLSGADQADPAVKIWQRELLAALTGTLRPLDEIATDLERALSSDAGAGAPRLQLTGTPIRGEQPSSVHVGQEKETSQPGPVESHDWVVLQPVAQALRAGALDRAQVQEYRVTLQRLADTNPSHRELWNELALVLISYLKEPAGALKCVREALVHFPDDPELTRLRDIVAAWAGEHAR